MEENLNEILQYLTNMFSSIKYKKFTAVITGSIARGDMRIEDGDIVSDIDILLFIDVKDSISIIKQELSEINVPVKQKISIIFTMTNVLEMDEKYDRGFLKDISSKNILFDGLFLENKIKKVFPRNKVVSRTKILCNALQELTYYYSKYNFTKNNVEKTKILKKWRDIFNHCSIERNCILQIENIKLIIKLEHLVPLQSTIYFLEKHNDLSSEKLFENVQNLVCLENQGLDRTESFYELRCLR
jgi:Nucleotidyltransferase domain.